MSVRRIGVLLMACLTLSGAAEAHKINPLQNKYSPDSRTVMRKVSEPVHEEITQLARACQLANPAVAQFPLVCTDRSNKSVEPKGNKYDSLIRGVWWNDDPNQLLYAARQIKWLAWMEDGRKIATTGIDLRGRPKTISPRYYMNYRTHYGDLQFMHAMASRDGESAAETQKNILLWAEFVYAVATGRLDTETTLDRVAPERLRSFFDNQPGWTVTYLLGPKYRLRRPDHFRLMATGSLLHMVQDSYSEAHTDRAFDTSDKCPAGRVRQFHSYVHQDSDKHGAADLRSAWQARTFTPSQDPVNASATLLAYVDQNAEWDTVRSYLADTVFCIDTDAQESGPGPFASATAEGRES